mmetsp:Transcript_15123/g.43004  ORF Transcript_15123/g.43004 Transcript_15123/m.43004 type:complete len:313 (+) Transcript_15123:1192-2130(+)
MAARSSSLRIVSMIASGTSPRAASSTSRAEAPRQLAAKGSAPFCINRPTHFNARVICKRLRPRAASTAKRTARDTADSPAPFASSAVASPVSSSSATRSKSPAPAARQSSAAARSSSLSTGSCFPPDALPRIARRTAQASSWVAQQTRQSETFWSRRGPSRAADARRTTWSLPSKRQTRTSHRCARLNENRFSSRYLCRTMASRLSDAHVDGVEAVRSHEDAVGARDRRLERRGHAVQQEGEARRDLRGEAHAPQLPPGALLACARETLSTPSSRRRRRGSCEEKGRGTAPGGVTKTSRFQNRCTSNGFTYV